MKTSPEYFRSFDLALEKNQKKNPEKNLKISWNNLISTERYGAAALGLGGPRRRRPRSPGAGHVYRVVPTRQRFVDVSLVPVHIWFAVTDEGAVCAAVCNGDGEATVVRTP